MPDVRQETGGCKTEDLFQKGIGAGCGAVHKPGGCTVEELNRLGPEGIPEEYVTSSHLVYNSPATLAYNSPGAEGFGVKRAGLAVPGSIMLIVSPGCCGRNTAEITKIKGYEERFFYLEIGETDLVTGRHLKVIPQAVAEIVESCRVQPSLVMICITCVRPEGGDPGSDPGASLLHVCADKGGEAAADGGGPSVALFASAQSEANPVKCESARLFCPCRSRL